MTYWEKYNENHQHPWNRRLHTVGIPMIVISLVVAFFDWPLGLGLFILGWILQFVGHAIEGTLPSFVKNPVYLIVGPIWFVKKVFKLDKSQ